MKNKNAHAFSGKIIDMLLACDTILVSAIRYQANFLARRTTFIPSYFTDLQTRIDQGYMMVGADKLREQRQATRRLYEQFDTIYAELKGFKVNIEGMYRKDKGRLAEVSRLLGFTEHFKSIYRGDQESLVQLLYEFARNLDADLRADLILKGAQPTILTDITNWAAPFRAANVIQENAKTAKLVVTSTETETLNDLYNDVIDIGKMGQHIFADNDSVKVQFVYSGILKRLNNAYTTTGKGTTNPNPPTTA